jgi:hypothetical protein
MKAKEFIIVESKKGRRDTNNNLKPRNPVAKNLNITASGAGQHKDRKASVKRGDVKHKGQDLGESSTQGEIQRKIDHNKKLLAVARQQGWNSTVKDIESAIANLQTQLKTAPTEMPAEKPRTSVPAGYKYNPYREEESDGDNVKIFHYLKLPNGKEVDVDFTPYQEMTGKDISLWIKLGMPKRQGIGPLDSEELEQMARDQGVAESSYTTEKQLLTRIRQIMHDRKLSGTESNAGELHRLKQQLKDMRSQQGVAEGRAGDFKEGKTHISPSGVKTNMDPSDDDYAINYGKDSNIANFRKKQGVDVKTGNKKVDEVDMSSPEFQRALASLKKKAQQGPMKTVYDPRTGKYKVVPVKSKGE